MLVAVLLSAVALAAAQEPRPCESPVQWEGRLNRNDFSKNFTEYAKISYDESNKRVREIAEYEVTSDREFYDVLYLHNENKEYKLNLRTRKCNVSTISRLWRPFGVPPFARYEGEANIGPANIPNEHATVITFYDRDEYNNTVRGVVTSPDCIPVSISFHDEKSGNYEHTTFYDITLGIPNPEVFVPPSECQG